MYPLTQADAVTDTHCYCLVSALLSVSLPTTQWAQQEQRPLCSHANVNINAKTLGIGVSQQSGSAFHTDLRYDDTSNTVAPDLLCLIYPRSPPTLQVCLFEFTSNCYVMLLMLLRESNNK